MCYESIKSLVYDEGFYLCPIIIIADILIYGFEFEYC